MRNIDKTVCMSIRFDYLSGSGLLAIDPKKHIGYVK